MSVKGLLKTSSLWEIIIVVVGLVWGFYCNTNDVLSFWKPFRFIMSYRMKGETLLIIGPCSFLIIMKYYFCDYYLRVPVYS